MGIPAQCVLLNQATCKNHWHDTGEPTIININELMKILGKNSIYHCNTHKKTMHKILDLTISTGLILEYSML